METILNVLTQADLVEGVITRQRSLSIVNGVNKVVNGVSVEIATYLLCPRPPLTES